jgi:DASH complex subunit Dad3
MEPSESTTTLPSTSNEDLTPLEQDVLDEYERLAENMKKVLSSTHAFHPTGSRLVIDFLVSVDIACQSPRHDGRQTDGGNPGWITAIGAQD